MVANAAGSRAPERHGQLRRRLRRDLSEPLSNHTALPVRSIEIPPWASKANWPIRWPWSRRASLISC